MNIVVDDFHLLGSFLGGGGGGRVNLAEPDHYFDHFPSISTHIFQGIIIFHIN